MCVCVIGFKINVRLGVVVVGSGCFYPSTHVSGDEDGLFPGKPLHAQQNETGQRDSWGIGRHVWTDARYQSCFVKWLSVVINISTWYLHTHTHTHVKGKAIFQFKCNFILFFRLWDWNWSRCYSGQVLAHHGTPPHQSTLQWPQRSHCPSTPVTI